MKIIVIIQFLVCTSLAMGQETNYMLEREIELDSLLTILRTVKTDAERKSANAEFKEQMENFIHSEKALTYNFTRLKSVGIIDSPDKMVRIINWNVENENLSHDYFCYVLRYDKKKKRYYQTELKDVSFGMPLRPLEMITHENWYGALYYRIIPIKKGSRTMYTVLGWDYNTDMSQLKLIDVMYFSGNTVKFGSPIFRTGDETSYRVFYEHSKKATMYLNYEPERKRIMMDHLSPESPALKEFRSFYVPDLSYDAFVYNGKRWELQEDVIGINDSEAMQTSVITENPRTGELESKMIQNEWVDPSNPNAPAGGNSHVAAVPDEGEVEDSKKKEKKQKVKKDKRDPSDLNIVTGGKKNRRKRR